MQAGRTDSRNRARDNRRYAADRPGDCKHCYFWKGKRKGCSQEECYYLLPEENPALVDVPGSLRFHLNRTIIVILCPACDPHAVCGILCPVSEAHTLNPACKSKMFSDHLIPSYHIRRRCLAARTQPHSPLPHSGNRRRAPSVSALYDHSRRSCPVQARPLLCQARPPAAPPA